MPRPARLAVDLLGFTGTRGGTETYVREIVTRLPGLLPGTSFAAVTNRGSGELVRSFFPGRVATLPYVGADASSWALGALVGSGRWAARAGADALWVPANFGPVVGRVPRVVTIHDAIYDEVGGGPGERVSRAITSALMRGAGRGAASVLTVSEAASRAIATHLHVDPGAITVVHNGSSAPPADAPGDAFDGDIAIPAGRRMLLSTGNRMPHKNFALLLDALAEIPADRRPVLVVTGGGTDDPLAPQARALGIGADVILPGWVSPDDLERLYRRADLYVCPSLAEGFGLPVVDAMRRGVPVLANDIPVLREVGAEHARYADASAPAPLARAIAEALAAPPSEARRAQARAWAETFTWDAAAAGTADAITRVLRARGRR